MFSPKRSENTSSDGRFGAKFGRYVFGGPPVIPTLSFGGPGCLGYKYSDISTNLSLSGGLSGWFLSPPSSPTQKNAPAWRMGPHLVSN